MANQIRLNPEVERDLNEMTIALNNSAAAIGNYLIKTGLNALKEHLPKMDGLLKECFHEIIVKDFKGPDPGPPGSS